MNIGEQILVCLLLLPFAALFCVIVEMVGEKTAQKRRERERAEIERVIKENRRRLSAQLAKPPPMPVVRGYDSGELFREDALIRIRKLEEKSRESSTKKIPNSTNQKQN